ncbi:39S ribosomal protein L32, mitochondrial [Scaptodrosophila lebanonensis]|uniref:Large ribosomal subunit protein bL32m n=1 Tax=Drosophila lebanonensis TaxID=7225 RepID=A0A6J2TLX4_DROLE|nr:39S ribosomal protein L32, mitochondrial [Scaptodrosophila lebanonensis]
MSRNLFLSITKFVQHLEHLFLPNGSPPPALALAGFHQQINDVGSTQNFNLKQLLGNGVLWAVPKHRRTVEKRLNRKFGYPEYVWKPLKVKTHLRTCNQCGHDYEVGVLCPHCYDKVRQETQLMQDKIQEHLGLEPVEQEVIVLYDGEKTAEASDALKGKRIVEMQKQRPMWFTKNLLQKSTQQQSETKEVKPTDLG